MDYLDSELKFVTLNGDIKELSARIEKLDAEIKSLTESIDRFIDRYEKSNLSN